MHFEILAKPKDSDRLNSVQQSQFQTSDTTEITNAGSGFCRHYYQIGSVTLKSLINNQSTSM